MNECKKIVKVFCVISLIEFAVSTNTTNQDMKIFESALLFNERWFPTTKQYMNIVFPSTNYSEVKNIVNLLDKIMETSKTKKYFIFCAGITTCNYTRYHRIELLWLPFKMKSYNFSICKIFGSSSNLTIRKKRLLLFSENIENTFSLLSSCETRFDDEIVVYYQKRNLSLITFEEIYKINASENTIYRNILSEIDLNKITFNMTVNYIWNRRNNLQGIKFYSLAERSLPFINYIQKRKDLNGNWIIEYDGYIKDILMHLAAKLNFSVITNMPKQRDSWNYLVEQMSKGEYDIGETAFTFTPSRTDLVDFSFGIYPITHTLAYAPNEDLLQLKLFMQPFEPQSWFAILVFIILVIIIGSFVGLVIDRNVHRSTLKAWKNILQSLINFVLRSVIGKRIGSEPHWNSTKVAFVFLIINGFLLITCYRALLVASLTAHVKAPPINSIRELAGSKYYLGVQKGSASGTVFQDAKKGDAEFELRKNEKIKYIAGSQTVMLENIANDATKASEIVLFIEKQVLQFHNYYPCRLSDIRKAERSHQGISGMIYRKDWPFKDLLNHHLLVMKQSGVMDKLFQPYLRKTRKICPNQQKIKAIINKPNPVSINATFSLYLLIFLGLIISFVCLSIEVICNRHVLKWFKQKLSIV